MVRDAIEAKNEESDVNYKKRKHGDIQTETGNETDVLRVSGFLGLSSRLVSGGVIILSLGFPPFGWCRYVAFSVHGSHSLGGFYVVWTMYGS